MMKRSRRTIWLWALAAAFLAASAFAVIRQRSLDRALGDGVRRRESAGAIRDLLRRGANPNARVGGHEPALFWAATIGPPETVQALLDAGASVGPIGEVRMTPLFSAALSDRLSLPERRAIVDLLLGRGSSLEERDVLGFTPLLRAVWSGSVAGVRVLLEKGADPRAVNHHGQNALFWADRMPDVEREMLRLLHSHGAK